MPAPLEKAVRNGGGGFVNHVLFWNCMAKNGTELSADSALLSKRSCPRTRAVAYVMQSVNKYNETNV